VLVGLQFNGPLIMLLYLYYIIFITDEEKGM